MTMPVYVPGMTINDNGELEIHADEMDAAGVRSVKLVEVEGGYHGRMINIPTESAQRDDYDSRTYTEGHSHARHAAAEIANEADARIAALERQLAESKAELRDWIENRGPKLAAEVESTRNAELVARLKEVEASRDKLWREQHTIIVRAEGYLISIDKLTERAEKAEARAEAAEKKFKDEREHSEALQESINKMVDDLEWANGKKAKATKLVARYMPAIKAYANEENWPDGRFDPYRDGRTIAGYEIAQAALSPAATAEQPAPREVSGEVKG